MTHEFKKIIEAYTIANANNQKCVLATLIEVNGSSYRKEGVRMLVLENAEVVGAVSGGCVEKQIVIQSQTVFSTGIAKVMTYDGRFRLGCEGVLYILLEKLSIDSEVLHKIKSSFQNRSIFELISFSKLDNNGTFISFDGFEKFPISDNTNTLDVPNKLYKQVMNPVFQLYIIGSEHDAQSLCEQASLLGWNVVVITSTNSNKLLKGFNSANKIIYTIPGNLQNLQIDKHTAVVIMNHNYAKDLLFLKALKEYSPMYIGLLGAKKRREDLLNDLLEEDLDISEKLINLIYGPTGLDIGAITPQEIAVSIVSEIMSVQRGDSFGMMNKDETKTLV